MADHPHRYLQYDPRRTGYGGMSGFIPRGIPMASGCPVGLAPGGKLVAISGGIPMIVEPRPRHISFSSSPKITLTTRDSDDYGRPVHYVSSRRSYNIVSVIKIVSDRNHRKYFLVMKYSGESEYYFPTGKTLKKSLELVDLESEISDRDDISPRSDYEITVIKLSDSRFRRYSVSNPRIKVKFISVYDIRRSGDDYECYAYDLMSQERTREKVSLTKRCANHLLNYHK